MNAYKVTVITSDVPDAGTDATVHIYLFGDGISSRKIPLKGRDGKHVTFNTGEITEVKFEAKDLGELTKIQYAKLLIV